MRARLEELDTREALAAAEVETLELQTRINLDAIAATDDARLMEAGAAGYRALGKGLGQAVPGLARDVDATLEAAFGPYLPSSDARLGPLSRLTAAGRAIPETLARGIKRGDPLALALSAALVLQPVPELPELELPVLEQQIQLLTLADDLYSQLPTLEQDIVQVLHGLGDIPQLDESLRRLQVIPELPVPPPTDYFAGKGAPAQVTRNYEQNIARIEINAPGADAQEIAREITNATRNEWRTLTEEADNEFDA